MSEVLVDVKNLKKYFPTGEKGKTVKAVDDISFQIYKGETLGVVGESGCGKSTTGRLVLHLLEPTEGTVTFDGQDLSRLKKSEMRTMRKRMQIIFQDPYASLDPRKTVFQILEEPYRIHHPEMSREEIYTQVERLIACVGLRPEHITRYPHEFSGGMRQRVMIAMAMSCEPELLIADEPTTALDVTIQAQILELMEDIRAKKNTGILMITHDLGVVAEMCSRVVVMYAGRIVEEAPVQELFADPKHPYTQGLIGSVPKLGSGVESLPSIPGSVPDLSVMPKGCKFAPRCKYAMDICHQQEPELADINEAGTRKCRCHLLNKTGKEA